MIGHDHEDRVSSIADALRAAQIKAAQNIADKDTDREIYNAAFIIFMDEARRMMTSDAFDVFQNRLVDNSEVRKLMRRMNERDGVSQGAIPATTA